MLAIGATKAKKMKASSGATSRKLTRRRRASALRSWRISLLLKEPLIELLTQVFAVVRPEDPVCLQADIDVGRGQMIDDVLVDQGHGGAPRRAVGHILEAGKGFGRGGEGDEVQGFLELGCSLHDAPGIQIVEVAVPNDGEGLVLAPDGVEEAAIGRLHEDRAAVIEQLWGLRPAVEPDDFMFDAVQFGKG